MKKFLNKFFALVLVAIVPVAFFLTACGATPSTVARGVSFVTETFDDETGLPVFEVDLNEPTNLEYKVYPSTWSGYAVTYKTVGSSDVNLTTYRLEDGVIEITSTLFQEFQLTIRVNDYEDTCIIRLKTYPTSIYTDGEVCINAYGVYSVPVYGVFENSDGSTYTELLSENEYNFLVGTDDPTIIEVPNSSRLKIYSLRGNKATTNVTVTLLDTKGNAKKDASDEDMSLSISVTVLPNASTAYARLGTDYNTFVTDGGIVNLTLTTLTETEEDSGIYKLYVSLFAFSSTGVYNETEIYCSTSNSDYAQYNEDEGYLEFYLTREDFAVAENNQILLEVSIWTELINDNSESFSLSFIINLSY